ncbi:Os04g0188400 [Oryza sativa Japonica Group]|jgi:hypothetical protein|uniref:Os04g0188400 protein n=1 Tax=Oryza sativa subsp. japonica TaxID=39947 RepID=Q0JEX6_ORYSJ|nr:hypothetical protein OsJ_13939 [Oryza sativa Japonica Group]KAF2932887.1 hypothetical protein DAI22_04g033900 [Oryza sativa Japonica Group]BAF14111.1 Os04g0188400 [Oryza sativa Japonica Group]|eukprot:NP_001052197.1 Os04g0188400 [Oryza sativa Japonica Group]
MKLLPLLILAMVMANAFGAVTSRTAPGEEALLAHGVVKTTTAEGTSIDNHHAIPRPEYDSWSSPGNMPGSGHDIGSEQAQP